MSYDVIANDTIGLLEAMVGNPAHTRSKPPPRPAESRTRARAVQGDDSKARTEVRHLRTPGLVRRHASMEKHKWLALTLLVVSSL